MSMNFKDFKFEVIDVTVQGLPELFVNLNGLSFNKKVAEDLGYPAFVRPMIDFENKAFAIQICKQNDDKAMKFSKSASELSNVLNINVKALFQILRTLMRESWNDGNRYKITGMLFPESKAMVFELNTAKELPPVRKAIKSQN